MKKYAIQANRSTIMNSLNEWAKSFASSIRREEELAKLRIVWKHQFFLQPTARKSLLISTIVSHTLNETESDLFDERDFCLEVIQFAPFLYEHFCEEETLGMLFTLSNFSLDDRCSISRTPVDRDLLFSMLDGLIQFKIFCGEAYEKKGWSKYVIKFLIRSISYNGYIALVSNSKYWNIYCSLFSKGICYIPKHLIWEDKRFVQMLLKTYPKHHKEIVLLTSMKIRKGLRELLMKLK